MERKDVEAVVVRRLKRAVIHLEDMEIDTRRSMKELGANSLDIVEVVSGSMRELRIRVPRTRLETLTNIDDLVDLLHNTVAEKT